MVQAGCPAEHGKCRVLLDQCRPERPANTAINLRDERGAYRPPHAEAVTRNDMDDRASPGGRRYSRPLHGQRHHRRCLHESRSHVHRYRDRAQILRHRLHAHRERAAADEAIRVTGKRNHTGHRVGEWHHRARLSDVQVRAMRETYRFGLAGYRRLARIYGCGQSTARDIVTLRTRASA